MPFSDSARHVYVNRLKTGITAKTHGNLGYKSPLEVNDPSLAPYRVVALNP